MKRSRVRFTPPAPIKNAVALMVTAFFTIKLITYQKRSFPDPNGSSSESQRRSNTKKASKSMIPQNEAIVKYSTKDDSDGRTQI